MKRFGLRLKFVLLIVGLLLMVFLVITTVLARQTADNLKNGLLEEAKAFTTLATKPIGDSFVLYQNSGRVRVQQEINQYALLDSKVTNIGVVDTNGQVLFNQHPDHLLTVDQAVATGIEPAYQTDRKGQLAQVVQPYIEGTGVHRFDIVYAISSASIDQAVSHSVAQVALFGMAALVVSSLLILVFVNVIFLRPTTEVSSAALAISSGKLERKIRVFRNDEIGDMARAVNQMAESLKADIAKLQEVDKLKSEFMMIASHNLRTPITVISGYVDTLKMQKLDPRLTQMIDMISANNQRLATFAEDMLTVSRLETGSTEAINKHVVELQPILSGLMEEFSVMAKEKSIKYALQLPPEPAFADISDIRLRNAVWNLLENALKFTKTGGEITLKLGVSPNQCLISVTDTGIGISPTELPKLFTKFHRGTSTLTYDYEGTGIGLYTTRLILAEMNGTIAAKSEYGKGSEFTITLPRSTTDGTIAKTT